MYYMTIIYLISYINVTDGASSALIKRVRNDSDVACRQIIIFKWKGILPSIPNVQFIQENDINNELKEISDDIVVHYFKAQNSNILEKTISYINRCRIGVYTITTVCQNPAYKRLLLSPYEIQTSDKIVFIDRYSYTHPLIQFIPVTKRVMIYLAHYDQDRVSYLDSLSSSKKPNECIIVGRGTSLEKCPKDMFEVFDMIKFPNIKFIIAGIPEGKNWVREEALKRDNVDVVSILPKEEWNVLCASFDICLYHLPDYCHASLDYNLGISLLLKVPVVFKGPEAPKERLIHGVNSYVATTNEELAHYVELLANSPDLRKQIGKSGRDSQLKLFTKNPKDEYHKLYLNRRKEIHIRISIPLSYKLLYFYRCYKDIIKRIVRY